MDQKAEMELEPLRENPGLEAAQVPQTEQSTAPTQPTLPDEAERRPETGSLAAVEDGGPDQGRQPQSVSVGHPLP